MSGVSAVLVVTEPSVSGISDLERILKTAAHFQVKALVCVNQYDLNPVYTDEIETYCRENGISFVGKIPFDEAVHKAVNMGKSAVDIDCAAGAAITGMYRTIQESI
jgi:MinD superfamily P-loop ATPase